VPLSDLKRLMRIEDEIRTRAKNELLAKQKASADMVTSKFDKDFSKKKKLKKKNQNPKNLNVQKKVFKKTDKCFNCGKQGHFVKACQAPKKEEKEAYHVIQDDNFVAMLFQVTAPSNNSD